MSVRDILLHLDTGETARAATDFAVSLAEATGAHLTAAGLAIEYVAMGGLEDTGSYAYLAEATEQNRANVEAAYQSLAAAVPAGVQTDFVLLQTVAGVARDRFGELARHFDLAVVGQGTPEAGQDDRLMGRGALFGSGKPVFFIPAIHRGPARLDKAMVCWDGGVAAARALAGALPLLTRASGVEVVTIARDREPAAELPGFNIARHLARHGVAATLRTLPPSVDVGATLLSHAAASGADFMVMGGYGRWRFSEFVLGGATRTILRSSATPVIMSH